MVPMRLSVTQEIAVQWAVTTTPAVSLEIQVVVETIVGRTITRWAEADEAFVRKNYPRMTQSELASALGRTLSCVRTKLCRMGMTRELTCEHCNEQYQPRGGLQRFCPKCIHYDTECLVCSKPIRAQRSKPAKTCSFNCKQRYTSAMRWCMKDEFGTPLIRKLGTPGRKRKTMYGYIQIYFPEHPMAGSRGYMFEHRLVMANHIGRNLEPIERIHHINGVKDDNQIKNLEIRIPATHLNGIGESEMIRILTERGYKVSDHGNSGGKPGSAGEDNE